MTNVQDTQELLSTLLVLTEPYNILQEIRHFADNSGRSSNINNLSKTSKILEFINSESGD